MKIFYVLFYGHSEDGRGQPNFYKCTSNVHEATNFIRKEQNNPYSTSKVIEYGLPDKPDEKSYEKYVLQ